MDKGVISLLCSLRSADAPLLTVAPEMTTTGHDCANGGWRHLLISAGHSDANYVQTASPQSRTAFAASPIYSTPWRVLTPRDSRELSVRRSL